MGVVLVAASLKAATSDPLSTLDGIAAIELAAGTAMFLLADAAILRAHKIGQRPGQVIAALASLAAIPLGAQVAASAEVAALAAIVTMGIVYDRGMRRSPTNGT